MLDRLPGIRHSRLRNLAPMYPMVSVRASYPLSDLVWMQIISWPLSSPGQPVSQDTLPPSDWPAGHGPAFWLADVTVLDTGHSLELVTPGLTTQVSRVGSLSCCHERDTWQCHDQCPGHLSHVSRRHHNNGHSPRVNVSDVSRPDPDNFVTTGRRGPNVFLSSLSFMGTEMHIQHICWLKLSLECA